MAIYVIISTLSINMSSGSYEIAYIFSVFSHLTARSFSIKNAKKGYNATRTEAPRKFITFLTENSSS